MIELAIFLGGVLAGISTTILAALCLEAADMEMRDGEVGVGESKE